MAEVVPISDVLRLADQISAQRSADKDLKQLLDGMHSALGDIVELLEKGPKDTSEQAAKALAGALKEALKSLPAPTVNAPVTVSAKEWTTLNADVEYDGAGKVKRFKFSRS
jgi:uncharacterized membrane protein YccC